MGFRDGEKQGRYHLQLRPEGEKAGWARNMWKTLGKYLSFGFPISNRDLTVPAPWAVEVRR